MSAEYERSPEGKATRSRYAKSAAGKAAQARYHATASGKATRKRYRLGKGKEMKRQATLKYRSNNRQAERAWNKKKHAKLAPKPCEICGDLQAHAHHDDYSRPLNVRWLCPLHHRKQHQILC